MSPASARRRNRSVSGYLLRGSVGAIGPRDSVARCVFGLDDEAIANERATTHRLTLPQRASQPFIFANVFTAADTWLDVADPWHRVTRMFLPLFRSTATMSGTAVRRVPVFDRDGLPSLKPAPANPTIVKFSRSGINLAEKLF
jgi:hypothetical protein